MLLVGDALWCPETLNDLIGVTDRHVVARGHSSLFVYDATTGALLARIAAPHQRMMDVAWIESHDATTIVVARHDHPSVEIAIAERQLRERSEIEVAAVPRPAMRTCVSRDGRTRVRAEQTTVVVERDGAVVQTFPGHWSYYQVAASADGAVVAFGGERIRVGVVATGEVRIAADPPGHVSGLAIAGARRIRVDSIAGARLFHAADVGIAELAYAPRILADGTLVGAGLRTLGRWHADTGAVIEHAKLAGKVAQIAWSRDGRRAAVATYETTGLLLMPHAGIALYEDAQVIATWAGDADPEVDAQAPSFALAPDGASIVLLNEAELVTLSLPGFTPIDRRAIEPGAQGIYYTPRGALAVSYDDKLALVGGATLELYSGWAHAWSVGGTYFAHAAPGSVIVRDGDTLAARETLPVADVVAIAIDDDRAVMWADRAGRTGVELPA